MKTWMIIVLLFLGFFTAFIIGIFVYAANITDTLFHSIDLEIGNQNFTQVYDDTLGQGIDSFLAMADYMGISILLGMLILIIITSYIFSSKKRLWILIEFVILIVSFIIAVTLQRAYDTIINSSTVLLDVYSNQLTTTSTFILNFPSIIVITWAISVIVAYGALPKPKREESTGDVGF